MSLELGQDWTNTFGRQQHIDVLKTMGQGETFPARSVHGVEQLGGTDSQVTPTFLGGTEGEEEPAREWWGEQGEGEDFTSQRGEFQERESGQLGQVLLRSQIR